MWSPQTDPLGLALQGSARARRFSAAANGVSSPIGPLPDPQWDAYFEAISQADPGKSVKFGYEHQPAADLTRDPDWGANLGRNMPLAVNGIQQSQQLGTPVNNPRPRRGQ